MWVFSFFLFFFFLSTNKYSLLIVSFEGLVFTYLVDCCAAGGRESPVFELTTCLCFSLDPDSDPLCMLLLIDFLMLRCREYQSLLQLYRDWGVRSRVSATLSILPSVVSNRFVFALQDYRNLSQLPNFSFSAALCHFCLSQQEDGDHEERNGHRHKADQLLQNTLIMFPGGSFQGDWVAALTLTCLWHVLATHSFNLTTL